MPQLSDFRAVWAGDFEYSVGTDGLPRPICFVALELFTRQEIRLWGHDLTSLPSAPFPTTPDTLFMAYAASAECSAFLALGWSLPQTILDLYIEFRHVINGRYFPERYNLPTAMGFFGLDTLSVAEKKEMQHLALRGFPFTPEERQDLLDYCASDVYALPKLCRAMLPYLNLSQAFLRGRYMAAIARIERQGIPIDGDLFAAVQEQWPVIRQTLIDEVDRQYHVFKDGSFHMASWLDWCERKRIPWPLTPTGLPSTETQVFARMAREYPETAALGELKLTLNQLDRYRLTVKADSRARSWLQPFGSKTGRNQPPASEFIFGAASWVRRVIQPPVDHGLCYLDWVSQEIGIVAALSDDKNLLAAYLSGDPYRSFGQAIGLIPSHGTKETHPKERALCKVLMLGVNYGMGVKRFAQQAKITVAVAQEILRQHQALYRQYWAWIEREIDIAYLQSYIETIFGWRLYVTRPKTVKGKRTGTSQTTLQNFPAQANAGEMLRLALCFMTEHGLSVCAPVHDAILIESPLAQFDSSVQLAQSLMAKASRVILKGFTLQTEATCFLYPEHYADEKGTRMWEVVSRFLEQPSLVSEGGVGG